MGIRLEKIGDLKLRRSIQESMGLAGKSPGPAAAVPGRQSGTAKPEISIHNEIIKWCNSQWPRWKYRHANPSRKSTDTVGCEDFTIFGPGGRTYHIECKAADGKLTEEQQAWRLELEMIGHKLHVARSLQDFLAIVENAGQCNVGSAPPGDQPINHELGDI